MAEGNSKPVAIHMPMRICVNHGVGIFIAMQSMMNPFKISTTLIVCLATYLFTTAVQSQSAEDWGIDAGMSYAKARSTLLSASWQVDDRRGANGQHSAVAYKQFPEIVCGNGRDAICSGRFIRSGEALLLIVDPRKPLLPVTFIERD